MPSILPFTKPSDGFFDDMATQAMGEAFDAAHKTFDGAGQFIYETVAAQIIAAPSAFLPPFLGQSLHDQFVHVADRGDGQDQLVAVENFKGLR